MCNLSSICSSQDLLFTDKHAKKFVVYLGTSLMEKLVHSHVSIGLGWQVEHKSVSGNSNQPLFIFRVRLLIYSAVFLH